MKTWVRNYLYFVTVLIFLSIWGVTIAVICDFHCHKEYIQWDNYPKYEDEWCCTGYVTICKRCTAH